MLYNLPSPALPAATVPDFNMQECRQFSLHTCAEVASFIHKLTADLGAGGFSEHDVFVIRLAVEEAVVNGIRHGNGEDSSKQVQIHYTVTSQEVLVTIEDDGPGFNPDEVPNPLDPENLERPGGRGVFLMRSYMTWVRFNKRGNVVTMCKRKQ